MKIVYPPTYKTILKIRKIRKLYKNGSSTAQVAKKMGHTVQYVRCLYNYDKETGEKL